MLLMKKLMMKRQRKNKCLRGMLLYIRELQTRIIWLNFQGIVKFVYQLNMVRRTLLQNSLVIKYFFDEQIFRVLK